MFQRLFNWIKFKTVPPSVNFKNRLFIERDNKQRRILTNLGLTFRNSKWVQYARANVSLDSITTSLINFRTALIILISLLFALALNNYLLPFNLAEQTYTIFWFMGDSFIYTKISFVALLLTSLSSHYEWSSIALQQADTLKHNQISTQDKKTSVLLK